MEVDRTLFAVEKADQLDSEIMGMLNRYVESKLPPEIFADIFYIVEGYAGHLAMGMVLAGFEEDEAMVQGWQASWNKLRKVMDSPANKHNAPMIAGHFESQLGVVNAAMDFADNGRPNDPATRTFIRTFFDITEHVGINQSAHWVFADD